jgi:hypothetical protein
MSRSTWQDLLKPMTRPSCSDQPSKLIELDPNDLVDPPISPQRQQLPSQLHRSSSHPDREDAVGRLESRYGQCAAFVVRECAVRELNAKCQCPTFSAKRSLTHAHMNIPRRVHQDEIKPARRTSALHIADAKIDRPVQPLTVPTCRKPDL